MQAGPSVQQHSQCWYILNLTSYPCSLPTKKMEQSLEIISHNVNETILKESTNSKDSSDTENRHILFSETAASNDDNSRTVST